jgi:hypothetical protein
MQTIIKDYFDWLKSNSHIRQLKSEWSEVTTPFLNHINDYIQIYIKSSEGDKIKLSDNGVTINNLFLAGLDFSSPSRIKERDAILRTFGVVLNNNHEVEVTTDKNKFPQKKHDFIQAILALDNMYLLTKSKVSSFFVEDVNEFLKYHDVRFSRNVKLQGKSGFEHKFDFLISGGNNIPERHLRVISRPSKQAIVPLLFSFSDTANERSKYHEKSQSVAILYESEDSKVSETVLVALKEYEVLGLGWLARNEWVADLAT